MSSDRNRIPLFRYILWTSIAAVVVIAAAVVIHLLDSTLDWIVNLLSILGSIASFSGVLIAIAQTRQSNLQIEQVATTAEATAQAVKNSREEIRDFMTITDIAQIGERIKAAQNHIVSKEFIQAYTTIQSTRGDLLRIHEMQKEDLAEAELGLESHITTLNVDMQSLSEHINTMQKPNRRSSMKPEVIHTHLADIEEVIIKIEMHFKNRKV